MKTPLMIQLEKVLRLGSKEDIVKHSLAVLGLFASDFPDHHMTPLDAVWDEDGVMIQSRTPKDFCTCQTLDIPKTVAVRGKGWHAGDCHLAIRHKLLTHPDLVGSDEDERETSWTFQWPHDIKPNQNAILTSFPSWEEFLNEWTEIVALLPERQPSLAEQEPEPEPEPEPVPEEAAPTTPTFEDDLDFTEEPKEPEEEPVAQPDPPVLKEAIAELDAEAEAKGEGGEAPPRFGHTPGRPGRKKGSTKSVLLSKKDATGSTKPVEKIEGKYIPACVRFTEIAVKDLDHLSFLAKSVGKSVVFPADRLQEMRALLDSLALRAAHLEHRGASEGNDPESINPLVQVTLDNVTSVAHVAIRELSLHPETPKGWKDFLKAIQGIENTARSCFGIISQIGAGPAVREPGKSKRRGQG